MSNMVRGRGRYQTASGCLKVGFHFGVLNLRCLWPPGVLEAGGWLCGPDVLETRAIAWVGTHQLTSGDSPRVG